MMTYTATFVTTPDYAPEMPDFSASMQHMLGGTVRWLDEGIACDIRGVTPTPDMHSRISAFCADKPIDWMMQPQEERRKKLLISDMDSTIIRQECIDELADMAGVKARVSEITERAMQGELDFSESLRARVALLEGLPLEMLQRVWQERITVNAGATTLVRTMKAQGAFTMLVSGGFTFFCEKVADAAGFDAYHANILHHEAGKLTGKLIPPLLHSASKAEYLHAACKVRGIAITETLAVGDGANDKEMIMAAGCGIAYYAKPILADHADACVQHTDLTTLLYFQGYSSSIFV